VAGGGDARSPVDVGSHVAAVGIQPAVARVDPHPNADGRVFGPRLVGERALSVDGCRDRIRRSLEGDEKPVTFGRDLDAVVVRDGAADQLSVASQDRAPAIAESLGK
jgi:hypothetical protein